MKPLRLFGTAAARRGFEVLGELLGVVAEGLYVAGGEKRRKKSSRGNPSGTRRSSSRGDQGVAAEPTPADERQRRFAEPTPDASAPPPARRKKKNSASTATRASTPISSLESRVIERPKWQPPPPFIRPEPPKPSGRLFVKVVLPEKPAREFRAFVGGADAGIAAMGFEEADARRREYLNARLRNEREPAGPKSRCTWPRCKRQGETRGLCVEHYVEKQFTEHNEKAAANAG